MLTPPKFCFLILIVPDLDTKKRHLAVTQNITEYPDLSRDHQDAFIIYDLCINVKAFSTITKVI